MNKTETKNTHVHTHIRTHTQYTNTIHKHNTQTYTNTYTYVFTHDSTTQHRKRNLCNSRKNNEQRTRKRKRILFSSKFKVHSDFIKVLATLPKSNFLFNYLDFLVRKLKRSHKNKITPSLKFW